MNGLVIQILRLSLRTHRWFQSNRGSDLKRARFTSPTLSESESSAINVLKDIKILWAGFSHPERCWRHIYCSLVNESQVFHPACHRFGDRLTGERCCASRWVMLEETWRTVGQYVIDLFGVQLYVYVVFFAHQLLESMLF